MKYAKVSSVYAEGSGREESSRMARMSAKARRTRKSGFKKNNARSKGRAKRRRRVTEMLMENERRYTEALMVSEKFTGIEMSEVVVMHEKAKGEERKEPEAIEEAREVAEKKLVEEQGKQQEANTEAFVEVAGEVAEKKVEEEGKQQEATGEAFVEVAEEEKVGDESVGAKANEQMGGVSEKGEEEIDLIGWDEMGRWASTNEDNTDYLDNIWLEGLLCYDPTLETVCGEWIVPPLDDEEVPWEDDIWNFDDMIDEGPKP
ncbi:hypothetical protein CJ030_MR6G021615 [Morella rubra]|uniref:Uncharacterized protein n=1 Tax=Morella rubra TaxID=262757 RepID=A0A6A1VF71_9ROSI|nr:hypothetical protein CJ030_MR6G021617 [Morella rubra]KAB1211195.1 hypothetical protein CJ030_MR6G021615 [Morella rubra]